MTRSQSLMGAKLLSAPPKSSAGAAHGSGHALRREHDGLRAVAEHGRRLYQVFLGMEVVGEDVRSHLSAWIRAPPTISEETASRLHLVERGKKNVRVSRASCVEWSDARESVFMVCGRRPRRVLKLRSRKTDAVRKLSIHHSPLLFTSQTTYGLERRTQNKANQSNIHVAHCISRLPSDVSCIHGDDLCDLILSRHQRKSMLKSQALQYCVIPIRPAGGVRLRTDAVM